MSHVKVTSNVEKNHTTPVTIKVRQHHETSTFKAYVRVGENRFRTHTYATMSEALNEAILILEQNQQ